MRLKTFTSVDFGECTLQQLVSMSMCVCVHCMHVCEIVGELCINSEYALTHLHTNTRTYSQRIQLTLVKYNYIENGINKLYVPLSM